MITASGAGQNERSQHNMILGDANLGTVINTTPDGPLLDRRKVLANLRLWLSPKPKFAVGELPNCDETATLPLLAILSPDDSSLTSRNQGARKGSCRWPMLPN
jgi:hypothetical protein